MIRHLLGDPRSIISTPSPTLVAKYSNQVAALLALYRLLDLELLHNGTNLAITRPPSYPNNIIPGMLETIKVRDRWKKLENWRGLLIEFRDCFNGVSLGEEAAVSINESPFRGSLAHLQTLSECHSNQKFSNVVQNFHGAALHWTVLYEITHGDSHELAVMPKVLSHIIEQETIPQISQKYQPHTRDKMKKYLQQHNQGELVLPLHLSLMLTPCFLLMLVTLVKCKFPRQAIYQVSAQSNFLVCHIF